MYKIEAMKKITLLAVVIIAASFASCKKNWVCECSDSSGNIAFETRSQKMKKSEADTWCKKGNDDSEYTCELK